jgi:hypothetical protein
VVAELGLAAGRLPVAAVPDAVPEPVSSLLRLVPACLFIAGGFVLTRRQGADPVAALGWGLVLLLTPGVLQSLRSSDSQALGHALLLGALALGARAELKLFDAVLAYAALSVVAARHGWGWLEAAPVALAISLFLLKAARTLALSRVLGVLAFGVCVLALAGIWARSRQPTGLDVGFPINKLALFFEPPSMTEPLSSAQGYGLGFAWATLPLAALGLLWITIDGVACLAYRLARSNAVRPCPWPVLVVALAVALPGCFRGSPYVLVVSAAVVISAWVCARLSVPRVAEGAIAINVLAALTFHWWYGW